VIISREILENHELEWLAPYAQKARESRGRRFKEEESLYRTCYQRDIDRIIHCTAFRRLEYKTQVFVNTEGDHYRTRLTHTFEVSQVAESLARTMNLNTDLTKAIALAHDLGHTPFGHAGEAILQDLTADIGGFEHNKQSLRVVEMLESHYPDFPGLNLTWEVREGLLKHSSIYDQPEIDRFEPDYRPSLEAQVVNLSDELAYICHDLEDALRAGIIEVSDLKGLALWEEMERQIQIKSVSKEIYRYQIVRILKDILVKDAVKHSTKAITDAQVDSPVAARKETKILITFSPDMAIRSRELGMFLLDKFYSHHRVVRMTTKAKWFLKDLFNRYTETPMLLPEKVQALIPESQDLAEAKRVICDYIAGMTDRYALDEYRKLVDPDTRV
jgi:dGTPase